MIKQLTTVQIQKLEKFLPDIRINDKGQGKYRIRGASDISVSKVLETENLRKVNDEELAKLKIAFPKISIETIDKDLHLYKITEFQEVQEKKVEVPKMENKEIKPSGFAGYMAQAAQELDNDMSLIKKDLEEKAKAVQHRMEESAKKMELESKEKVDNLGKHVDERLAGQAKGLETFTNTISGRIEVLDSEIRKLQNINTKMGEILKSEGK